MNQGLSEAKPRVCVKCAFEADTADTKCPRCGKVMLTKLRLRTLGVFMTICGAFIAVTMATVSFNLYPSLSQPNDASKFTGTAAQARQILLIFGLTVAAGVFFVAAGLWQAIFGRRSRPLVWLSVLIVLAIGVVSVWFVSGAK